MDFLNHIFLENTIKSYLIVVGIILFVLLFKRFLSRYLAALIYEIIKRHWPFIKKQEFVELVIKPLSWFILVIVSVFLINSLRYPQVLNFKIYHTTSETIIDKLGAAFIILAIVNFLISVINFLTLLIKNNNVSKNDRGHHQLLLFFKDFIKAILYILGLVLLIKFVFNVNVGTLIGGLGIAGAALALAARESIENIIASFVIFLDKPFFTGDNVKVNAYSGRVERIGLRSTRIRTLDKTLITVPNKQMVDSVVDNLSFRSFRRGEIKMELPSDYTSEKIKAFTEAANQLLKNKENHLSSYTAMVTDYSKSGITVTIEFFTIPIPAEDFTLLKQEVMLSLMEVMQKQEAQFSKTPPEQTVIQPNAGVPPKSNNII